MLQTKRDRTAHTRITLSELVPSIKICVFVVDGGLGRSSALTNALVQTALKIEQCLKFYFVILNIVADPVRSLGSMGTFECW